MVAQEGCLFQLLLSSKFQALLSGSFHSYIYVDPIWFVWSVVCFIVHQKIEADFGCPRRKSFSAAFVFKVSGFAIYKLIHISIHYGLSGQSSASLSIMTGNYFCSRMISKTMSFPHFEVLEEMKTLLLQLQSCSYHCVRIFF